MILFLLTLKLVKNSARQPNKMSFGSYYLIRPGLNYTRVTRSVKLVHQLLPCNTYLVHPQVLLDTNRS